MDKFESDKNRKIKSKGENWIKFTATLSIVFVLVLIIFGSFFIISAGQKGIVITLGKPEQQSYDAGIHFKIPIIQSVIKMDIQTQKYETKASSASRDLQVVSTDIAVNYHLSGDSIVILYSDIGVHYQDRVIQPAVQEVVKASTAQFTAEELITKRDIIKEKIDIALRERLSKRGIIMETTSITNFDFSEQFNVAIEQKVTAEQNALTAKNKLAQIEFEAEQVRARANGERDAQIAKAEGEAKTIELTAIAEAERVKLIQQQLIINPSYIEYVKVNKWDGVLPKTMFGNSMPLIQFPLNSTS